MFFKKAPVFLKMLQLYEGIFLKKTSCACSKTRAFNFKRAKSRICFEKNKRLLAELHQAKPDLPDTKRYQEMLYVKSALLKHFSFCYNHAHR